MKLIVDGLAVNFELIGKGKCVVLLHGWGDNLSTFSALMSSLRQRYTLIALDLPGFGSTQPPKQIWDLDNYADFLADFLLKLGVKRPYAVIGHSNGGALAVRALATGKIKADKLILIAASGIRDKKGAKRLAVKTVAKIGKATTLWLPTAKRQQLRRKLYGTIGSDLLAVPGLEETFKRTVRQDLQADAAKLDLPVLLIFASNDPAIPLSDGQRYHELIKHSYFEVLDANDHFIHQDQPDKTKDLIEGFL